MCAGTLGNGSEANAAAVAVIVMEPPLVGVLERLARRLAWQAMRRPSVQEALGAIRGGVRIVIVQVGPGASGDGTLRLVDRLHSYWSKTAVIGVLTAAEPSLETALRRAGVTYCLSARVSAGLLEALVARQLRRLLPRRPCPERHRAAAPEGGQAPQLVN